MHIMDSANHYEHGGEHRLSEDWRISNQVGQGRDLNS